MTFTPLFKTPKPTAAEKRTAQLERRKARQRSAQKVIAAKASDCRELAHAKPLPRSVVKKAKDREEDQQIRATRSEVWARSQGYCEGCGDTERQTALRAVKSAHEMHEQPSRKKTMGLPPASRFNTAICSRQCQPCHQHMTENKWELFAHSASGWDGDYDVIDKATGEVLKSMRRSISPIIGEPCAAVLS